MSNNNNNNKMNKTKILDLSLNGIQMNESTSSSLSSSNRIIKSNNNNNNTIRQPVTYRSNSSSSYSILNTVKYKILPKLTLITTFKTCHQ